MSPYACIYTCDFSLFCHKLFEKVFYHLSLLQKYCYNSSYSKTDTHINHIRVNNLFNSMIFMSTLSETLHVLWVEMKGYMEFHTRVSLITVKVRSMYAAGQEGRIQSDNQKRLPISRQKANLLPHSTHFWPLRIYFTKLEKCRPVSVAKAQLFYPYEKKKIRFWRELFEVIQR